jgi:tripartite-type tricarboxylate transporter receptor subunit TctC
MWTRLLAAMLALAAASVPAYADTVADFYKGKQINLIVGYGPGGGYDVYGRLVARHIGRHIPGNPNVVVQNMPGAGSLRAANFIFSAAPKDGTSFGIFARNMPLLGILGGNPNVQFDARKFTWLGSSSSFVTDAYLMIVRADAPVKTIEDARRPGGPQLVLGGTAEGATGNDVPVLLRDTLGLNIRLIAGYTDSNALFLAIDRGEIQGRTTDYSSIKTNRPDWLKPNSGMNVLLQFARATRHPDFPNVPTARELARTDAARSLVELGELPYTLARPFAAPTDAARSLIELAELPYTLSRPFAAPPGVPAERAKALQDAFLAAHKDPQLLEEAARLQLDITPISGDEILAHIERISKAPADQLDYIRKLLAENKGG